MRNLYKDLMVYCCAGCQDCTLLPYAIQSLQGYLGKLVRSVGTDITLYDILIILDEHYNNATMATATVEDNRVAAGESDPSEYNEVVTTKDTEKIDAFLSHVIRARMGTAYTGVGLNVMTQALCTEDWSLPQGLTIQNAYTEMHDGSKNVAVVVRNSMAEEEEDPSGKSSCGDTSARATNVDWHDRGIRWGPRPPDTKADCETKAGKIVWGVRFEWIGILATSAGRFHLVWVPQCLLLRAQWTWLCSFNWTCDQSHQ